jgi:hypothetical protein
MDGVTPHLVDNRLSILQYANDTIIFMDGDLDKAKNLKLLLCAFEQLSGLKSTSIRVSFSVLARSKTLKMHIPNYLVAKLEHTHLGI